MRPVKNWTTPTLLTLDMWLYGILEVDEKSQTLTSHIWIQSVWPNEFLTWNSSDFCGIDMVTVSRSMLWTPDIVIQEDASDSGSIHKDDHLTVTSSGTVHSNIRQRLTSTCRLNLFHFPFDNQHCNISFTSTSYMEDILKLETYNNDTFLAATSELIMITRGEWQLENIEVVTDRWISGRGKYCKLIYMVKISRKPLLYVIILIIPLFYLLVLDLASFFIHEARGEKLSFKVTVLLSISVLLLILQDMLPSTEDSLPMIATFCVSIFTMVGVSVMEAMVVIFLIDWDDFIGKKVQSSDDAHVETQMDVIQNEPVGAEEKGEVKADKSYLPLDRPKDDKGDLLKLILEEVREARQEVGKQDKVKKKPAYYRKLAEIIDSVFFGIYLLTFIAFVACMYLTWFHKLKL
ncbi:5-hydroxytryptamine receptor 3A-like [Scomber japonicus]|uniref:5-hydroxytryptamine receptor 3A-like n=1 Tax=Scomber japonicus TaxID=13676 RepID=UPI0023051F68|nr:5-hydroxytryptamine receptor 3A-like [Scomber japonicus]